MAVNKVIYGNTTLIDLTSDTVTAADLVIGKTAHKADGTSITGTLKKPVDVPTLTTPVYYDGTQKTVTISSYDSNVIAVSGTTQATNPGTYNVTFSLKNTTNYEWRGGTTSNKTVSWKIEVKIVTWGSGSDTDISNMLKAHYKDFINIHDYWAVGDERSVSLSAMSATGVGESHVAQTVTMVLMNAGGKTLVTAVDGKSECAFIVGQKNVLANDTTLEGGYINSSSTNTGSWDSCARRTWCNDVYKAAIPSSLRALFKQHKNITASGSSTYMKTSNDYFALPSEKEVFGRTTYANSTAETNNTQFEYYETSANIIKKVGNSVSANSWWERSPNSGNYSNFCQVTSSGGASKYSASHADGLAPFGVI